MVRQISLHYHKIHDFVFHSIALMPDYYYPCVGLLQVIMFGSVSKWIGVYNIFYYGVFMALNGEIFLTVIEKAMLV